MTEPSNIEKIIAERDFCWNLLMRFAKDAVKMRGTNKFTNGQPTGQNIWFVELTDRETADVERLQLHIALNRAPTPTQV